MYFTNENLNFLMKIANKTLIILMTIKITVLNFKRYLFRNFINVQNNNINNLKFGINLKNEEKITYSNFLKKIILFL